MAKVVVCDDDALVRATVTSLCEQAGLEVVAETDRGGDAFEMVRRFGVEILVLDLSLLDGSGERTIASLNAENIPVEIVVFTAFVSDAVELVRIGAREVVEKPDFERLGEVLARLGAADEEAEPVQDRRTSSRPVDAPPKVWRSPAGVSSYKDLPKALAGLEAGDCVIAVTVVGLEALEAEVGPLLTADCRLAVAASLRDQLRIQDLLHEAPDVSGFIALLRGGDARAAGAVWSRLIADVRGSSLPGEVKGAASRVDSLGANDAMARALGALQGATVDSPPFLSV
jgi:CheY-like chemotaxis protein